MSRTPGYTVSDGKRKGAKYMFKTQPVVDFYQANPVSTTIYPVLPVTYDVRLIGGAAWVTWTVQPDPLEIIVTVDGRELIFKKTNPVSATRNYLLRDLATLENAQNTSTDGETANRKAFIVEGQSLKVDVRTTGGTVSALSCRIYYETLEVT
jgi:hypothetical protein